VPQLQPRRDIEQRGQTTLVDFLNNLPDVSTVNTETSCPLANPGQTTVQLMYYAHRTTLNAAKMGVG